MIFIVPEILSQSESTRSIPVLSATSKEGRATSIFLLLFGEYFLSLCFILAEFVALTVNSSDSLHRRNTLPKSNELLLHLHW